MIKSRQVVTLRQGVILARDEDGLRLITDAEQEVTHPELRDLIVDKLNRLHATERFLRDAFNALAEGRHEFALATAKDEATEGEAVENSAARACRPRRPGARDRRRRRAP